MFSIDAKEMLLIINLNNLNQIIQEILDMA